MKKIILILLASILMFGCVADADIASNNLSKDADMFKIYRRVVFYNGITSEYILMVEGFCSIHVDTYDNQLELTVKTPDGTYLKHFLGLSDNNTYFAEQLYGSEVDTSQYKVIFKPSAILPNINTVN